MELVKNIPAHMLEVGQMLMPFYERIESIGLDYPFESVTIGMYYSGDMVVDWNRPMTVLADVPLPPDGWVTIPAIELVKGDILSSVDSVLSVAVDEDKVIVTTIQGKHVVSPLRLVTVCSTRP